MHQCTQHSYRGYGPCAECIGFFGRDVVWERKQEQRKEIGESVRERAQKKAARKRAEWLNGLGRKRKKLFVRQRELKRQSGIVSDRVLRAQILAEHEREKQLWLEELRSIRL